MLHIFYVRISVEVLSTRRTRPITSSMAESIYPDTCVKLDQWMDLRTKTHYSDCV